MFLSDVVIKPLVNAEGRAHRSGGLLSFYVPQHMGHDDFLSSLALAAWTVQPEEMPKRTPLTPTQLILPEPEDVNALPLGAGPGGVAGT
mgnify:CR=1 FL=1